MDTVEQDSSNNSLILVKNIDHIIQDEELSKNKNLQFSLSFYKVESPAVRGDYSRYKGHMMTKSQESASKIYYPDFVPEEFKRNKKKLLSEKATLDYSEKNELSKKKKLFAEFKRKLVGVNLSIPNLELSLKTLPSKANTGSNSLYNKILERGSMVKNAGFGMKLQSKAAPKASQTSSEILKFEELTISPKRGEIAIDTFRLPEYNSNALKGKKLEEFSFLKKYTKRRIEGETTREEKTNSILQNSSRKTNEKQYVPNLMGLLKISNTKTTNEGTHAERKNKVINKLDPLRKYLNKIHSKAQLQAEEKTQQLLKKSELEEAYIALTDRGKETTKTSPLATLSPYLSNSTSKLLFNKK